MKKLEDNVLFLESEDTSFDNITDLSGNSGYVEAYYSPSGVIILRPTDDKSKDVSVKELKRMMK